MKTADLIQWLRARPEPECHMAADLIAGQEVKPLNINAESVYSFYPRKVAKPAALRAISKALKKMDHDELASRVKAFAALWPKGSDMTYCPHPATWFNQERYNDDPSTWTRPSPAFMPQKPVAPPPMVGYIIH